MTNAAQQSAEESKPYYWKVDSRALLAEFIAMVLFVWIGCGTAVSSQAMSAFSPGTTNDNSFLTAVALAFGVGIVVLAYTIAPISGGHINPAVTTSLYLLQQVTGTQAVCYIVAQCLGAIVGAALVWGSMVSNTLTTASDDQPPFLLGTNVVATDLSLASAFLAEAMGTFVLVWTVLLTAVYPQNIASNLAPLVIGFSVFLAHLVLIPITGCGINPARSLGPMLVVIMAGDKVGYEGWWIYYTAPFVGGAVAALVAKVLFQVTHDGVEADDKTKSSDGKLGDTEQDDSNIKEEENDDIVIQDDNNDVDDDEDAILQRLEATMQPPAQGAAPTSSSATAGRTAERCSMQPGSKYQWQETAGNGRASMIGVKKGIPSPAPIAATSNVLKSLRLSTKQ